MPASAPGAAAGPRAKWGPRTRRSGAGGWQAGRSARTAVSPPVPALPIPRGPPPVPHRRIDRCAPWPDDAAMSLAASLLLSLCAGLQEGTQAGAPPAPAADPIEIRLGDAPFTTLRFRALSRPVLWPVLDRQGRAVTR